MRSWSWVLLFMLGFLCGEARAADEYRERVIQDLLAKKKYIDAIALLQELLGEEPANDVQRFNLGAAYFAADLYPEALRTFEGLAVRGGSIGTAATFFLARSHLKLGEKARARELLEGLLQSESSTDSLRSLAEAELEALPPAEPVAASTIQTRKSLDFSGILELGAGWNSNIYTTAVSEIGESVKLTSAPDLRSALTMGAELPPKIPLFRRFFAYGRVEELAGFPLERSYELGAQVDLGLPVLDLFFLELTPRISQDYLAGQGFLAHPGARGSVSVGQSDRSLSLIIDYSRNLSRQDRYSYLTGLSAWVGVQGRVQTEGYDAQLSVSYGRELLNDLSATLALIPLRHRHLTLSFDLRTKVRGHWALSFQPTVSWKIFDTPTVPERLRRIDLFEALTVGAKRKLTPESSVFVNASLFLNQSSLGSGTISDRNYEQFKALSGFEIELF